MGSHAGTSAHSTVTRSNMAVCNRPGRLTCLKAEWRDCLIGIRGSFDAFLGDRDRPPSRLLGNRRIKAANMAAQLFCLPHEICKSLSKKQGEFCFRLPK